MPRLFSPQRGSSRQELSESDSGPSRVDLEAMMSDAQVKGARPRQRRVGECEVRVPPVRNREEYVEFPEEVWVHRVLQIHRDAHQETSYKVQTGAGQRVQLPTSCLLHRPNGRAALRKFTQHSSHQVDRYKIHRRPVISSASDSEDHSEESPEPDMMTTSSHQRQARAKRAHPGFVDSSAIALSSDEERQLTGRGAKGREGPSTSHGSRRSSGTKKRKPTASPTDSDESSDDEEMTSSKRPKGRRTRSMGHAAKSQLGDDAEDGSSQDSSQGSIPMVASDLHPPKSQGKKDKKRKRTESAKDSRVSRPSGGDRDDEMSLDELVAVPTRRSKRVGHQLKSMKERGENDIPALDASVAAPARAVGAREQFKELPHTNEFRLVHCQTCDTCGGYGESDVKGPLVFCQGCTTSYHQACLGYRSAREHLVTKVGDGDFVLQCRRCINVHRKKDALAPRLDLCHVCHQPGPACAPFRSRRTAKQEEKEREENDGEDPIVDVDPDRINNVHNVLFRCVGCKRSFHYADLPSRELDVDLSGRDISLEDLRFMQYCHDWSCLDCVSNESKVQTLVAWRPKSLETYTPGQSVDKVAEDDKEYLIKWEQRSYFQASWMPGAWVWGVTAAATRKAFAKRNDGYGLPKMTSEDAIPEEYLRVDIVMDVKYTSVVTVRSETIDRARVKEVATALVKYKGLGYEEVVWERPPKPSSGERWADFVAAYEDWVLGRYVHLPKRHFLHERIEKVRAMDFETKLLKKEQPESLTGGKMMEYQLDGLNWLTYKWYKGQNAILADEMGLGKTIQVIGLLSALVHDHKCWPFLVVVPNSTCLNWRREIKRWAPHLRAVAYYGSAEARRLAKHYELFPNGARDLQCHVVITSYEAPVDESSRKVLKDVPWAGLIVDEGQRLKNDKNLLYEALRAMKAPFKVLMTGTPLQNNTRELFNLLQFLDASYDASQLEEEFADLDAENVSRLHEMIRPFFLRRTKAQVLTFLPPMAQIIVPVTMSVLQKKLYKSILAKNPELIKSIFGRRPGQLKQTERSNLNNILMQLRKCLCHPFVYSKLIEEKSGNAAVSHRTLVEASSKLQLLELMLPALKERGHRVLIFSQFLEMLDIIEDFLDGLQLPFERLDGSIGSLQKQKRIDAFNAPDSPLFAFLLSTRAGGVGINLATADTVIIMDPDFNPHQDIQALSRAHRIGQQKKVLVFQLMTRDSAEEKIMQIGRKKMALDHVLIDKMGDDDEMGLDVQSILKHGASALFNDEDHERDIHYDATSVEKLLDRSQAESTQTGDDHSAESQFSFARVWANDRSELRDGLVSRDGDGEETPTVDATSIWDKLLQEREQEAELQRAAAQQTFGRGKRRRQVVNYDVARQEARVGVDADVNVEMRSPPPVGKPGHETDNDTEFQAREMGEGDDDETEDEDRMDVDGDLKDLGPDELGGPLQGGDERRVRGIAGGSGGIGGGTSAAATTSAPVQGLLQLPPPTTTGSNINKNKKLAIRTSANQSRPSQHPAQVPAPPPPSTFQEPLAHHPWPPSSVVSLSMTPEVLAQIKLRTASPGLACPACQTHHPMGYCPIKLSGYQLCPLCGMAHYGAGPKCPHLQSEAQIRVLLAALKNSVESKELKDRAATYLRGVKGALVQRAKKEAKKLEMANAIGSNGGSFVGGGVSGASGGSFFGVDVGGPSGGSLAGVDMSGASSAGMDVSGMGEGSRLSFAGVDLSGTGIGEGRNGGDDAGGDEMMMEEEGNTMEDRYDDEEAEEAEAEDGNLEHVMQPATSGGSTSVTAGGGGNNTSTTKDKGKGKATATATVKAKENEKGKEKGKGKGKVIPVVDVD